MIPKTPKSGVGLVLPTGARHRTLIDKSDITAAGKYYYDKIGQDAPSSFYTQDAFRKGRRQYISLLDGTKKKVSDWDNVKNEWELTALGIKFFANAVDRYTVLSFTGERTCGSVFLFWK